MKDAKQTVMGIPVAVFITFWMWFALQIPRKEVVGWLFPAFGILFVMQALYMLCGHYLRNWLEWRNIEYAVTNRRTIVRCGLWRIHEASRPHSDSPTELRGKSESEVGDIIFQSDQTPKIRGLSQQIQAMFNPQLKTGEFGLYALQDPATVYRIILAQTSDHIAAQKKQVTDSGDHDNRMHFPLSST